MTLPALIIEGAEAAASRAPAYSAQIAAFFARYKTLPISVAQKVRQLWGQNPVIGSILATGGTTAVVDYMTSEGTRGNKDVIQAINDSAVAAGIPGIDLGNMASTSLLQTRSSGGNDAAGVVSGVVSGLDKKSSDLETRDPEFAQELALKELMKWANREVSSNPERIKEFHQNMRIFLSLSTDTLNKAIEVYLR